MKKLLIILMLVMAAIDATAQSGLNINSLFDGRFRQSSSATEIVVTGKKAEKVGLDVYHSISVTDMALVANIERLVTSDGAKATSKETEFRSGRLYYGYYVMPRLNGKNRYIFYLNQSLARNNPVKKVTLIYMEGRLNSKEIKKLIGQ